MDISQYRNAWDNEAIVRLKSYDLSPLSLPETSISFLTQIGLPKHYRRIDFTRLEHGLVKLMDLQDASLIMDEVLDMWVIGKYGDVPELNIYYENCICIRNETGQICEVNSPEILPMNSSVEQMAEFLLVLHQLYKPGELNPIRKPTLQDFNNDQFDLNDAMGQCNMLSVNWGL